MQQLQAEFPEQYNATSANRFRAATNVQCQAAYRWYAAHMQALKHPSQRQQQQQQQPASPEDSTNHAGNALQFVMLQDIMVENGLLQTAG
jgi:hypothetical protein